MVHTYLETHLHVYHTYQKTLKGHSLSLIMEPQRHAHGAMKKDEDINLVNQINLINSGYQLSDCGFSRIALQRIFRQGLIIQSRLALNSGASCLHTPNAGNIFAWCHTQLIFNYNIKWERWYWEDKNWQKVYLRWVLPWYASKRCLPTLCNS